jgi:hypothetical protein
MLVWKLFQKTGGASPDLSLSHMLIQQTPIVIGLSSYEYPQFADGEAKILGR